MCLSPTSAWGVGCQAILGRQLSKGTVREAEKPALQNRPKLVTQTCEYHLNLSACLILAFCVEHVSGCDIYFFECDKH